MSRLLSLFFFLSLLFTLSYAAFEPVERKVSSEKIEALRSDSDFEYAVGYKTAENPFARIWQWIIMKILQFLSYSSNSTIGTIIFYGIVAAILIYAIIKIFNIQIINSFYGSRKSKNILGEIHDDISKIDFDSSINKAFKVGDYREVVRLYYLRSLQFLDEMGRIKWEKGKTNLDYLYEINHEGTKTKLSDLNYYFEYAVYGDFPISEELAKDSKRLYQALNDAEE